VVVVLLLVTVCLVWLRRQWSESPRAAKLDRFLGIATLIVWATYKTYVWLPGVRGLEYSLPLQFCDFTGFVAPLVLLTNRRPLRAILYFWGLGFSILAFIAPDLHEGVNSGRFWLFWLSHSAIVGSALYDLAGRGFRPAWRDWRIAVAVATVYVAVVAPFDALTHFDYGYVGPSGPGQPPILEALGPWPWRLAVQAVLAILALGLLLLPWEIARRLSRGRADRQPSDNVAPTVTDGDGSVG
jgi:hypothetical integral membrane protein (TIGR02206 family)